MVNENNNIDIDELNELDGDVFDENFEFEFKEWLHAMTTLLMYMPIPKLGHDLESTRHRLFSEMDMLLRCATLMAEKEPDE